MNGEIRETVIGAVAVLGLALVLGFLYGGRNLAATAATGGSEKGGN